MSQPMKAPLTNAAYELAPIQGTATFDLRGVSTLIQQFELNV